MIEKFDLQKFANETLEAVSGKEIIYLFRVAEDAKKEDAYMIAFPTENSNNISKDADSTATKDGAIRTPSVAEIEISSTSILAKGDKTIGKLKSAMLSDKLVECWEVNLAEPGTDANSAKYKAVYYQGYITELNTTSNAEDNVEVEITYGVNGTGADGYATVTKEQRAVASYVYKDVTREAE